MEGAGQAESKALLINPPAPLSWEVCVMTPITTYDKSDEAPAQLLGWRPPQPDPSRYKSAWKGGGGDGQRRSDGRGDGGGGRGAGVTDRSGARRVGF